MKLAFCLSVTMRQLINRHAVQFFDICSYDFQEQAIIICQLMKGQMRVCV